jgi:hypothetical protein
MGIRLLALSQRTLHVDSFGKPADAGGVSRYLRAVGKWSGRRAGGIQCDLDGDLGERRGELLSVCSPVRSSAGLRRNSLTACNIRNDGAVSQARMRRSGHLHLTVIDARDLLALFRGSG